MRSWISEATAEAYAFAGNTAAGLRALHAAEVAFDGARAGNTPAWLGFYNDQCHVLRRKGRCLMFLGRAGESVAALNGSLATLPETFVRERSGTLIDISLAHLRTDPPEIEETCRVAIDAATLAQRTGSGRNPRRLQELMVDLLPYGRSPSVQDLQRRLLLA